MLHSRFADAFASFCSDGEAMDAFGFSQCLKQCLILERSFDAKGAFESVADGAQTITLQQFEHAVEDIARQRQLDVDAFRRAVSVTTGSALSRAAASSRNAERALALGAQMQAGDDAYLESLRDKARAALQVALCAPITPRVDDNPQDDTQGDAEEYDYDELVGEELARTKARACEALTRALLGDFSEAAGEQQQEPQQLSSEEMQAVQVKAREALEALLMIEGNELPEVA